MSSEIHFQRALLHHKAGELVEAKSEYLSCLRSDPNNVYALINLGSVCRRLGALNEALAVLRQASVLAPTNYSVFYNLGNALRDSGAYVAATQAYENALRINPKDDAAWYNLALTLADMNKTDAAEHAYRNVVSLNPRHLDALLNLSSRMSEKGEYTASEAMLEQILQKEPSFAGALNNLATLQQDTGRIKQAIVTLQRAINIQPNLPQPRSNLLLGMQYQPNISNEALVERAKTWGKWAEKRAAEFVSNSGTPFHRYRNVEVPPLRIGYISADLCMHPVGLFLQSVISSHDPSAVQPVCYSNGSRNDEITAAIRFSVIKKSGKMGWRNVADLDDVALARRIHEDKIDVLVDLSGHTGKSRVAMFALRPAPVQVSWLGYFATTGLPAMDFVILDPFHAPPGTETQFTERIIRLPHNRFCYSPVSFAPEVSPPPFLRSNYISFGSFNNTAKLNDEVLNCWAEILRLVPQSRLILKWRTFADGPYRTRIEQFFQQRGIEAQRLDLRPMSPHRQLLEEYADVDIALDPFPFSGGHTSCEALWMGVPVVTLPQDRVVSRQTWSFLNNIGLPGLAAQDRGAYVQLAVKLANSPETLKDLRSQLRDRMHQSPLCDAPGFTRLLEQAFIRAWSEISGQPTITTQRPAQEAGKFAADVGGRSMELVQQLKENPEQPAKWLTLGELMAKLLRHEAVVACSDEVLKRTPDSAAALTLKGNALKAIGAVDAALPCYQRVLALLPASAEAHSNLGAAYQTLGRHQEAITAYRAAIASNPKVPVFWGNLSMSLTYSEAHGPTDVLHALTEFDRKICQPLRDVRPHTNLRDAQRRLRVGYLSPDFRKHAVAYFALPLIEGHRRSEVEVFCYYSHHQQDEWTARFRAAADSWVPCADLDDSALAERIRADAIDILVDLAGHTANNRLLVFARKPAPVQLTWMGYVTTTGLSAMDWRVTHLDADPPGSDTQYSERLWRLPGTMWCYRPLPGMPEVSPPPFLTNGYITFGSFNRFSKVSVPVLAAWAEILQRVPDSRLVLFVPEGEVRQGVVKYFESRGVDTGRISLYSKVPHEQFWALHEKVDIALDPFPFGGGTTTCETLWLGVPIITVTGSDEGGIDTFPARFASRMGFAFLNSVGVPELASRTISDYVGVAVSLANDRERIEWLRRNLRPRMSGAPLTDEARFVVEMETAYREMWRCWCEPDNGSH